MWISATRENHSRKAPRYQSGVTDEEWRVIEPHLPPAKDTGRPRAWPLCLLLSIVKRFPGLVAVS